MQNYAIYRNKVPPKAKTARTKSRFDRDGKARSHCHTLRNPASGSRQEPPKPLCPTLFLDERILRADSGQERTTAGRCPVTHGSHPTFDQYTGFASGERKSAREKTDIFPQGNRLEIFPCTAASRHEQPANGGKRTKRLRFCIAFYRTSFNDGKQAPTRKQSTKNKRLWKKSNRPHSKKRIRPR